MSNVAFADKTQSGAYNAAKFNAADCNELKAAVNSKVDTVGGKGLSTEDYSSVEKALLATFTPPEISPTYAGIDTSDTNTRMILVLADETRTADEGPQTTLHIHTGSIIKFLMIVP